MEQAGTRVGILPARSAHGGLVRPAGCGSCWLPLFLGAVTERDVYSSSGVGACLEGSWEGAVLVRSQWQNGPFGLGYCKDGTHVTVSGCILVSFISLHFCMCVGVTSTPKKAENHPI